MRLFPVIILFCCLQACAQKPKPAEQRILHYSEHLDQLQFSTDPDDESPLSIHTRRNYRPFSTALRAAVDRELSLEGLYDSEEMYPEEGSYLWKNVDIGNVKNIQLAYTIESYDDYMILSFSCFDTNGLYCQHHPEIVQFIEKLAREHLYNQTVEIVPEHGNLNLSNSFIQQHFSAEIAAIDQLITDKFPEYTDELWIELTVDKQGRATCSNQEKYHPIFQNLIGDWVDKHPFPIITYENSSDTVHYAISWSAHIKDEALFKLIEKKLRTNQISDTVFDYFATLIPADSLRAPFPLALVVSGRGEAHFFRFTETDMTLIGSFPFTDPGGVHIEWTDYNYDGTPEIELVSFGNMNGNSLRDIYHWDRQQQKIILAGSFFGDLERLPERGEVLYAYYGSWYMPRERAVYRWVNGRLIPRAKRVSRLRTKDMIPNNCCIFEIYENPGFDKGIDSLKLVSRKFILDESENEDDSYEARFFEALTGGG